MAGIGITAIPAGEVAAALGSALEGLDQREAATRLRAAGPNELPRAPRRHALARFLAQLTHFMALLLWAAAGLAFAAAMPQLGWAIAAVVVLNGAFGFWQEHRAERALAALESLLPRRARALRGGVVLDLTIRELVPGDVVLLEAGDRVPADVRVVAATLLRLDLSLLTGESLAADRDAEPCAPEVPLARARCVAPAGATVASGRARGVVFATGPATELGRVARLSTATRRAPSTLEERISGVVRILTAVAVAMGVVVVLLMQLLGAGAGESLLFGIGIIVANVPEGLLPTVTVTLAANVRRMARRRALVSRLSAVETLGAVDVVCTDKTGTLTLNELRVRMAWLPAAGAVPARDGPASVRTLLVAAALANDAHRSASGLVGDPVDRALLTAAAEAGIDPHALRRACPRLAEVPFEPARKLMTAVVRAGPPLLLDGTEPLVAVTKGAAVSVLARCASRREGDALVPLDAVEREAILAAHDALARDGLRLVALAVRQGGEVLAHLPPDALERELVFLGLLALEDPPRPGVDAALAACRRAGITVTLVTGDHGLTARAVAEAVGLWTEGWRVVDGPELAALDDAALEALLVRARGLVFARVAPEDKLRLVRAYQRLGHVVAVTGDGVNDAPALHAAHVGVAMGRGGTDVARAAADVVLLDDDFGSIAAAVEEGRATFANIRKFLTYVLTSNVPEIAPFLAMVALGIPPALGILQILAIDLGTDMLPALALGAEPPEPGLMSARPRPRGQPLLDRPLLGRSYLFLGVLEAVACLAAFALTWRAAGYTLSALQAVTPALLAHAAAPPVVAVYRRSTSAAFAAIVCCQVGNVLACRSEHDPVLPPRRLPPPVLRWAVGIELALLLATLYLPPLQSVFSTSALPLAAWPGLLACAPAMVVADDLRKRAVRRLRRPAADAVPAPAP